MKTWNLSGAKRMLSAMILLLAAATFGHSTEFRAIKMQALHRDARAQYELGRCYEFGDGVGTDPAKAIEWYRKAAEQGLAVAQYNLGRMYLDNEGDGADYGRALKWLR